MVQIFCYRFNLKSFCCRPEIIKKAEVLMDTVFPIFDGEAGGQLAFADSVKSLAVTEYSIIAGVAS